MEKIKKLLQNVEEAVLILCLVAMCLVLLSQIILRSFFNMPIKWAEEIARFLQIWITFLGIGYGVRRNAHVGMTLLKEKMPAKLKHLSNIFCSLVILFVFVVLFISSLEFVEHQNILSTASQISMRFIYSVIPIGCLSYILYGFVSLVNEIKALRCVDGAKKS